MSPILKTLHRQACKQWNVFAPRTRGAVLVVGAVLTVVGIGRGMYPFTRASTSASVVDCSSTHAASLPCEALRLGVPGDWFSDGEKEGAQVQYEFEHPVIITAAHLANRSAAGSDILDAHFEFWDGERHSRSKQTGPINDLTEPTFTFPRRVKANVVKFIVDKTSDISGDVGLAVFDLVYTDLQQETDLSLSATCSAEHPNGNACGNALVDVPNAWWTPEDEARGAWIELTFAKKRSKPVTLTGIRLEEYMVTDPNDSADNVILDGHFELKNGEEITRFPAEGGLGPIAQYRDKAIPVDPPVPVTAVRFIVDKVPESNSHIGIEEFDLQFDPNRLVPATTNKYIAVTIVSSSDAITVENTRAIDSSVSPKRVERGIYNLQALNAAEQIIDEVKFSPAFRDVVVSFGDTGPQATSIVQEQSRNTVYLVDDPSIDMLRLINTITGEVEIEQVYDR